MKTPSQVEVKDSGRQAQSRRESLSGSRLRKHADYQRVYSSSRKRQSASMSWFLSAQDDATAQPRVGLTAGKVLGKAHERNRIKRRMRDILRRHVAELAPGTDLVLHPRRTVLSIEFTKLEAEIVRILGQARAEAGKLVRPAAARPTV